MSARRAATTGVSSAWPSRTPERDSHRAGRDGGGQRAEGGGRGSGSGPSRAPTDLPDPARRSHGRDRGRAQGPRSSGSEAARDRRRTRSRGNGGKAPRGGEGDRKSTRLNSSHSSISYAVFCLKKKINQILGPNLVENRPVTSRLQATAIEPTRSQLCHDTVVGRSVSATAVAPLFPFYFVIDCV